jgi:methylenetetrahydrofolate--tRNA-(uracil-5-)-methyltransferase
MKNTGDMMSEPTDSTPTVHIIGAGLAGTECAWQLAERGVKVRLYEQKPVERTPAQQLDGFAELVCSNSFRGAALVNAVGLLKEEMRRAGSLIMSCGTETQVPAGGAFAVDRERFSEEVTRRISDHPLIEVVEGRVDSIPEARPVVLATGPLTGTALASELESLVGGQHLAYYDAIAPVVAAESLDWDKVFRGSRYDKGGDAAYVNCPLNEEEYAHFVKSVIEAEKVVPKDFEEVKYFEGCLPIEVLAERGEKTLSFGCMKPVGLVDPRTDARPHAVVQLRAEDNPATAYNLVGFQTRMKWPEQKRVFRMIPGLENAEFVRLGSVHRNTFVDAPVVLDESLQLKAAEGVFLAGQITGVEGYIESAACGLVLGISLAREVLGLPAAPPPATTALGAITGQHLQRGGPGDFQPSNVVWSMFPPLENRRLRKRARKIALSERALQDLPSWLEQIDGLPPVPSVDGPAVLPRSPEAEATQGASA